MRKEALSAIRNHRLVLWTIVGAAAAITLSMELLAVESNRPPTIAGWSANKIQPAESPAVFEPTKLDIVPSPVIEPNPVFFVGTDDGSAGSYDQQTSR
jgi:hypothetical protein